MKILVGLGAAILLLMIIFGFSAVGVYNDCIRQENGLKAQWEQNQNSYDSYFKKVKEVAQIPDMYTNDLKKLYDSTIQGRYGRDGSRAMFQWIREVNPTLDVKLYTEIQQVIESGRNDFQANQTTLIDKKRVYENSIQSFPRNIVAGVLGFPKLDLSKYRIITSEETDKAFETHRSAPLNIR